MNRHDAIALKNIKNAFNWEVGGWYNSIQDYDEEEYKEFIPSTKKEAKEIIYYCALNYTYGVGSFHCRPTKEVRFAGSDFIKATIDYLFETDEDIKEIAEIMEW